MIGPRTAHRESRNLLQILGSWSLVLLVPALVLLPLPIAFGLVGGSVALALALIDPFWTVCWAVLSVPVQEYVQLPDGITVTQAVLLLSIAAWGLRVLAYPQHQVRLGSLGIPLLLMIGALATSSIFSPYSFFEATKETLRWLWVLIVYLIVVNRVTDRRRAVIVLACLLVAPTADALLGLWQFITATGPPSFGIAGGRFMRAYGTIGQPNSFAGYMNMAWPLAVAAVIGLWPGRRQKVEGSETGDRRRMNTWFIQNSKLKTQNSSLASRLPPPASALAFWLALVCAGILLAALFASFSRGGWVGAIGGAVALAVVTLTQARRRSPDSPRSRQRQGVGLVVLCVAGIVLLTLLAIAGLLPTSVAARLDSITANLRLFDVRTVNVTPENFAVVERMAHIQAGWGMFTTYPLLGVGPGNFTLAYPAFSIPPWVISQGHAHNYYLHMAAEAGIVGIAAYLLLLSMVIRQAARALRVARDPFWCLIVIGGCGMIAAVMVHNVFENLHVLNLPIQLGTVWGLLVVAERNAFIMAPHHS